MTVRLTRKSGPHGRWRAALWGGIAMLLLAPLVAMRVTDEVAWTGHDFAAAAVLLVGAGAAWELAVRLTVDRRRRAVIGAVLVVALLIIWADGAVGIA